MIALASDHAGYQLKKEIIDFLEKNGFEYKDFGCYSTDSVDYPDFAIKASQAVSKRECEKGILICGTGIGMAITANKIRGIRCANCFNEFSAIATREHNDSNMLALGARITDTFEAIKIVDCFLRTPFSNDPRHTNRINKIKSLED